MLVYGWMSGEAIEQAKFIDASVIGTDKSLRFRRVEAGTAETGRHCNLMSLQKTSLLSLVRPKQSPEYKAIEHLYS